MGDRCGGRVGAVVEGKGRTGRGHRVQILNVGASLPR